MNHKHSATLTIVETTQTNQKKTLLKNLPTSHKNRQQSPTTGPRLGKDLAVTIDINSWTWICNNIFSMSHYSKLQLIQYKILHRVHLTQYKLHKMGLADTDTFTHCTLNTTDDYHHATWLCPPIQTFWKNITHTLSSTGCSIPVFPSVCLQGDLSTTEIWTNCTGHLNNHQKNKRQIALKNNHIDSCNICWIPLINISYLPLWHKPIYIYIHTQRHAHQTQLSPTTVQKEVVVHQKLFGNWKRLLHTVVTCVS